MKLDALNKELGLYFNNNNATEFNFNRKIDTNNIRHFNALKLPLVKKIKCRISDLNLLKELNYKGLEELKIAFNSPDDINILEYVDLSKFKILEVSNNHLSEINISAKVNFKNLIELNLSRNKILDIVILKN